VGDALLEASQLDLFAIANGKGEAVIAGPGCNWEGPSQRVSTRVGDEGSESFRVVNPLRIPSAIRPQRGTYLVVVR